MASAHPPNNNILVVEDDESIRETMLMMLELEGYTARGAANGREALKLLRQMEPPCLILLDLMMPVMDGWQFRQEQVRDPELASIPVVIVSALASIREKVAGLNAAGYLQKPVEPADLLHIVRRLC
jgi:CheY-like chemotaxis protein